MIEIVTQRFLEIQIVSTGKSPVVLNKLDAPVAS